MGKSYQLLEWDSSFFGFDVFSINSNNETTIKDHLHQLEKHDGSLVYLFTDLVFDDVFLTKYSGKFVGTKVIFSKNLQSVSSNNIIKSIKYDVIPRELLSLAFQSGEFSRFKIDTRLARESFEELYKKWLLKAIDNIDIETLVYSEGDIIKGFISVEFSEEAVIGLFAVDETMRGKGIGRLLLNQAEYISKNKGYNNLKIPAQKKNFGACGFYLNSNYKIIEERRNYHFKY
jgi:dTDP-4-amino-4,6-dideoxy-D-galactose acyltransferase